MTRAPIRGTDTRMCQVRLARVVPNVYFQTGSLTPQAQVQPAWDQ